jgi:hypothetical protein
MANFDLKENLDVVSAGITASGKNMLSKTGDIIPYAGVTPLTTATGTSGTSTITVGSATGAFVGQGIYGTGLNSPSTGLNYITSVSGTTITVAYPLTSTISGSNVRFCPVGWLLCDGNNGTPNLTGRYLVGANSSTNIGASLGSSTHTHSYSTNNFTTSGITTSHSTVDVGVVAGGGVVHAHTVNAIAVNTTNGNNNLLVNSGNAGGPIQFNDKPHSHNANTGVANFTSITSENHAHAGITLTGSTSSSSHATAHTVSAVPSGNALASDSKVPFILMNYIIKV